MVNLKMQLKKEIPFNLIACEKYWFVDENLKFPYKVKDIANEENVTVPELTGLVCSSVSVTPTCEDCEIEIEELHIRQDFHTHNFPLKGGIICDNCFSNRNKTEKEKIREDKQNSMEMAFKTEAWKALNVMELETLIVIAESKSKSEIYDKLFQGASTRSEYGKKIWKRIDNLESQNLIFVERSENRAINQFHILGELRLKLKQDYPDLFIKEESDGIITDTLQFTMRKFRATGGNLPAYSGFFQWEKDVVLKRGVEYKYGAWLNDDGSIFIKLVPADESNNFEIATTEILDTEPPF